jgi:hypothetical protein
VIPLVGAVLAFGAVPSASAASCAPLAGEQVVAESRTAVVIKGGLEPDRESSGNYGNGSYYACVLSVGRRIRIGSYHGGPLVEESLAAFQFAGHYLTFIQYEAGTGTAVEQYDLTTGRGTFDDISFRGTVRASLNDGSALAANSDGVCNVWACPQQSGVRAQSPFRHLGAPDHTAHSGMGVQRPHDQAQAPTAPRP